MPKIEYTPKDFKAATLAVIFQADDICREYVARGFTLTLRQLFYQFVSRDLIPNKSTEYSRLGSILNDARLAGMIDWNHMEDRTRNVRGVSHWPTPSSVIDSAAAGYRIDKWARQPWHVEVWIEKDALVGVIERICRASDVNYFSCRGYTSQSEVWAAARRLSLATTGRNDGRQSMIIHLGDHDPSGIDMTRDISDRLALFCEYDEAPTPIVRRIALNMDQIEQYTPPPNPAKLTDSRADKYIARHGDESWELDALDPTVIEDLISAEIDSVRDLTIWDQDVERERRERAQLDVIARQWDDIVAYLDRANDV